MMRKLLFIFIIVVFLIAAPLSAYDPVSNAVKLSVTVTNCVFVGVTKYAVTSSIVPTERIGTQVAPITFSFDPYTKTWNTSDAYIYAISFIKDEVTITLTPAQLSNGSTNLPYTLDIISSSSTYCNSYPNLSSTNLESSYALVDESSSDANYRAQPRVMSWQFKMSIDAEANASSSTTAYSATFILKISSPS